MNQAPAGVGGDGGVEFRIELLVPLPRQRAARRREVAEPEGAEHQRLRDGVLGCGKTGGIAARGEEGLAAQAGATSLIPVAYFP